jgi:hypothetical protein
VAVIRKESFVASKPLSDKGTAIAFKVGAKAHAKRGGLTPAMRKLIAIYNAKVAR